MKCILCIWPILSEHTPGAVGSHVTAPGEQLGVRCLAQGHLSRGIEGGESAGYSLPPTNNPWRTWDSNPQPLDYESDSLTIRPRLPPEMNNSIHPPPKKNNNNRSVCRFQMAHNHRCKRREQHWPVNNKVLIWGFLVADRTHPGGFLLIHLDVERSIKALQVWAGERSTGNHQPHLSELFIYTQMDTQVSIHYIATYCSQIL